MFHFLGLGVFRFRLLVQDIVKKNEKTRTEKGKEEEGCTFALLIFLVVKPSTACSLKLDSYVI